MLRRETDARPSSTAALKEKKQALRNNTLDFYEDWSEIEPSAQIIDFYYKHYGDGEVHFGGLW